MQCCSTYGAQLPTTGSNPIRLNKQRTERDSSNSGSSLRSVKDPAHFNAGTSSQASVVVLLRVQESAANQLLLLYQDSFQPWKGDTYSVTAFYIVPAGLSIDDKADRHNWILLGFLSGISARCGQASVSARFTLLPCLTRMPGLPKAVAGSHHPLDWDCYVTDIVEDLQMLATKGGRYCCCWRRDAMLLMGSCLMAVQASTSTARFRTRPWVWSLDRGASAAP
jgi:hypothetical protein